VIGVRVSKKGFYEYLGEAEDHLLQAKAIVPDSSQEAHVEMHLGDIAMELERYEEALIHYQRVADLEPGYPTAGWTLPKPIRSSGNLKRLSLAIGMLFSYNPIMKTSVINSSLACPGLDRCGFLDSVLLYIFDQEMSNAFLICPCSFLLHFCYQWSKDIGKSIEHI
jgi:tetratricopeptide (TPR) repeat protein